MNGWMNCFLQKKSTFVLKILGEMKKYDDVTGCGYNRNLYKDPCPFIARPVDERGGWIYWVVLIPSLIEPLRPRAWPLKYSLTLILNFFEKTDHPFIETFRTPRRASG